MSETEQPQGGQRIGQGMWILFWIILLAGLAWFFARTETHREYPNQHVTGQITNQGRELVLLANRAGHYTLTGSINGQEANFLLDTGASDVVIPGDIAKQLGLQRGPSMQANTANGIIRIYQTQIDDLQIGPIHLTHVRAAINPHMDGDILLGMSALRSLELIHRNNQLLLRQSY